MLAALFVCSLCDTPRITTLSGLHWSGSWRSAWRCALLWQTVFLLFTCCHPGQKHRLLGEWLQSRLIGFVRKIPKNSPNQLCALRGEQIDTEWRKAGKRPLGRARRRWEDNIRMNLKEIYANTRKWVGSSQDRDYWIALWMRHWNSGIRKPLN